MIKRYKENEVDELVKILKDDGVISVPTDTVYGLCARINSKRSYENLLKVKKRPSNKWFPVMCADEEQIKEIAVVYEYAQKLINSFMPGPITLILKKNDLVPEYVNNGKDTIAIRMATSNILKELIKKVGSPIYMTSANQSGEETCCNLDEIEKACPKLDGMLEGYVSFNKASTIVDCSKPKIEVLREGPISKEEIMAELSLGAN